MTKTMSRAIILTGIMQIFLMSSLAQSSCGPQPEGGCNECGPYPTPWTLDYCPSQTNSSSVSPTTLCNKVGDAPTVPTVVVPIYQDGLKETYTTYDCANTTYQYAGISYTASGVLWDPALPSTFGLGNVPSFSSQAYVNVTSSDTNLCPSPGRVNIGSPVTWNVINNTPTSTTVSIDFAALARAMEGVCEEIPAGWSFSTAPLTFTKTITTTPICCGDGSVGAKKDVSGSLSASITGNASTPSYPLPITLGIVSVQLTASGTLSISGSITSTSDNCPGSSSGHYCLVPAASFTATGSISLSVFTSSLFSVTGSLSGSGSWTGSWCYYNSDDSRDTPDETPFHFCYGDIELTGSYTLLSGATVTFTPITLVTGDC